MRRLALGLALAVACTPTTPPPVANAREDPLPARPLCPTPEESYDDCFERCGSCPPRDLVGCDAAAARNLWTACCARVRQVNARIPKYCARARGCSLAPHVSPYSPDLMSTCQSR